MNENFKDFNEALGFKESSGRYSVENGAGYLGKYQMGEAALVDAGYYKPKKSYNNKWDGQFTGKDGVYSKQDFLSNKQAQENAHRDYKKAQWGYLKNLGADKYLGKEIDGVKITQSGLLAGAHLVGHNNVAKYLNSNGKVVPQDKNGVPVDKYMKDLAGYDVSEITKLPSDATRTKQVAKPEKDKQSVKTNKSDNLQKKPNLIQQLSEQITRNVIKELYKYKDQLDVIKNPEYKYEKSKGSSTGGASSLTSTGTPQPRKSSKKDEDGHWITTPQGNHVFIEDSVCLSSGDYIPFNAKGRAYSYAEPPTASSGFIIDYGIPEVYYSNHSPEYWEVQNDPEMIAHKRRCRELNRK